MPEKYIPHNFFVCVDREPEYIFDIAPLVQKLAGRKKVSGYFDTIKVQSAIKLEGEGGKALK